MVANAKLKSDLLDKTGWASGTLYSKAAQVRKVLDMDTYEAIYLLALQHNLKLKRYGIADHIISRVRDLQLKYKSLSAPNGASNLSQSKNRRQSTLPKIIQIAPNVKLDDPLLPDDIKRSATEMASIYPLLYYLENSIRTFICKAMVKYYGPNWWSTVKPSLQQKVSEHKADDQKNSWHQKRGAREVDYLDFKDLKGVITKVRTRLAADNIIPREDWIDDLIDEVYPFRCVIAHMNPLKDLSKNALKVKVQYWNQQIKGVYKQL